MSTENNVLDTFLVDNGFCSNKFWYKNGLLHREDGPAVEHYNGYKEYRYYGKLHREDGPAVISANDDKQYWIEGVQYTENQFLAKISPPVSCAGKVVEFQGKKYRLEEVKE